MTFTIELLPDEPIMLLTFSEDFKVGQHIAASDDATRALLDTVNEPVFNVLDLRKVSMSFDDIMLGSNTGARSSNPIWKDPRIRETLFVSNMSLVNIAVKGLRSATFNNIKAQAFSSVEDALAYAREQVSAVQV